MPPLLSWLNVLVDCCTRGAAMRCQHTSAHTTTILESRPLHSPHASTFHADWLPHDTNGECLCAELGLWQKQQHERCAAHSVKLFVPPPPTLLATKAGDEVGCAIAVSMPRCTKMSKTSRVYNVELACHSSVVSLTNWSAPLSPIRCSCSVSWGCPRARGAMHADGATATATAGSDAPAGQRLESPASSDAGAEVQRQQARPFTPKPRASALADVPLPHGCSVRGPHCSCSW